MLQSVRWLGVQVGLSCSVLTFGGSLLFLAGHPAGCVVSVMSPSPEVCPEDQGTTVCAALRMSVIVQIVTVWVGGGDEVNHHKCVPVIHVGTPALLQGQFPSL